MSYQVPADFKVDDKAFLNTGETGDPDIYLLRVPKGFDITKLDGRTFSNTEIAEILVEDKSSQMTTSYELGAFSGQGFDVAPLVKSKGKSSLGSPVKGFLCVNKSYKPHETASTASKRASKVTPTGPVPMIEGLRVRFTPFGSGTPVKTYKHSKKKKKRKRESDDLNTSSAEDIIQPRKQQRLDFSGPSDNLANISRHREKKVETMDGVMSNNQTGSSVHNHLHTHISPPHSEAFNSSNKHKKHKKEMDLLLHISDSDNIPTTSSDSSKHKKKKKKKHREESLHEDHNDLSVFLNTDSVETNSKKWKRQLSYQPSIEDNVVDLAGISDLVKSMVSGNDSANGMDVDDMEAPRKKKLSSGYATADASIEFSPSVDSVKKKKKKKKKHKGEID